MAARDRDEWKARERRKSTRVEAKVALQLSGADEPLPAESITTETINIGAGGLYCHVAHFIAPLVKLDVTMVLPVSKRGGQVKNEVVRCGAVVVRCQPAGKELGGYRIACFFNEFDGSGEQVLEDYLKQHAEA
jgi:hypothetical protein